jgi:hypothetical protein
VVFEPPAPRQNRRIVRRGAAIAATLVIATVGSAAAGVWIALRERPRAAEPTPTAVAPGRESPGRARDRTPVAAEHEPTPASDPADERASDPIEPAGIEPAGIEPEEIEPEEGDGRDGLERSPARRQRASSRTRSRTPRRSRPAPAVELAPPGPPPAPDRSAIPLPSDAPVGDIVSLANQRRKDKRWRAAEALYERAMRDHAGTDAAAIATVASASLHLDHLDDPAGALRRFHRALRLRPDGPVAEEARWGLAETHRALGDDAAERAALRAFLSAHPRSVNAALARRRLAQLGAAR